MKNLKLNNLSSNRFDENELSKIKGGQCGCVSVCGCRYANSGGSSTSDNANANGDVAANRTHSGGCYEEYDGPQCSGVLIL